MIAANALARPSVAPPAAPLVGVRAGVEELRQRIRSIMRLRLLHVGEFSLRREHAFLATMAEAQAAADGGEEEAIVAASQALEFLALELCDD